jgi:hypothetical protein
MVNSFLPISICPCATTGVNAFVTILSFNCYSNLDCLEPVVTCCRISGSTICCYSSPSIRTYFFPIAITEPRQRIDLCGDYLKI